ncbi:diadenosine tetraphosphate (Ap4A) HIT family hydrolase [Stella humosa]|uniref:Diadenosine tetraphosphate (Ap4A) HIT family hydrolase n=1 Tax=Stella humosa TaxID=94 RepID=A0A3N1MC50_9PROT|nr:HIT family protein [Stella humosa]ROQ00330.1 diadenosine tetraphosphate (Ap4A) HIT family hydrolase [Stella humosa]BBK30431.1 HIT family protein [Stella humosa]
MSNATMTKFGFPRTLVAETAHWTVLVRPQQVTLGSLVLVCKEPVTAFGAASPAAFADLQPVIAGVERMLKGFVDYERINYLMLMMVDPDVHFHVIPRHPGTRERDGVAYADAGWPGPPNLGSGVALDEAGQAALAQHLRQLWSSANA